MSLDVSIVMIRQKSNDSLNNYIVRFTRETLQVRNLISGLSQTLQVRNLICYICIFLKQKLILNSFFKETDIILFIEVKFKF